MDEESLSKFRFKETFTVEFVIEAASYQKAKRAYDKLFDKNITLGYDTWKDKSGNKVDAFDYKGGKFHVSIKNQDGNEIGVIEEIWGEEE